MNVLARLEKLQTSSMSTMGKQS